MDIYLKKCNAKRTYSTWRRSPMLPVKYVLYLHLNNVLVTPLASYNGADISVRYPHVGSVYPMVIQRAQAHFLAFTPSSHTDRMELNRNTPWKARGLLCVRVYTVEVVLGPRLGWKTPAANRDKPCVRSPEPDPLELMVDPNKTCMGHQTFLMPSTCL